MTKRKSDMILRTAVILTALLMIVGAVCLLFRAQYNQYGVSHFLTITINRTQPQTYVGELEDHAVYLEQIDQNGTYFCTVDAQSIPLDQAIQRRLVSINDWKHFAETVRNSDEEVILEFENYEISLTDSTCVFRPLTVCQTR